jgi:hypothetical protein
MTTQRHNPEDLDLNFQRRKNLKCCTLSRYLALLSDSEMKNTVIFLVDP